LALPDRIRHRFPIFERLVYVDSCAQGALADSVRRAYLDYLELWNAEGSPWEQWVGRAEGARAAFARLVNAEPDEVAVTTSVSAGVNSLLSGLRFPSGRDKIVISDFEFPTVGQIAHAQEERGGRVVHVPEAAGTTIPLEHFDAAIDEETALVAVTHACYRNGSRIDAAGVVELAHERGALVLLDVYQTAGVIPLDVRVLGVDFLATGTVKYLLGSAGLGFFYCRRDLVEEIRPAATGWFAAADIDAMDITRYAPSPTARRFESGTPPVPSAYAGLAGLELVEEIGVAETEEHVRGLATRLIEGVEELGAPVVTPKPPEQRGALVAIASTDERALVAALRSDGVVGSCRDGNLRVSLHAYNSADDVDAVIAALARHRDFLA
jgi:selenocysteine lyase/cysteine desulfurase